MSVSKTVERLLFLHLLVLSRPGPVVLPPLSIYLYVKNFS